MKPNTVVRRPSPQIQVASTKVSTYILTGQDILDLLAHAGVTIPLDSEVEVTFNVPGGGDYSNVTLDVDGDNPVTVTVTEKTAS